MTRRKGTILVVDDEPGSMALLADLLKKDGYEVRTASNGSVALESVLAEPPDLILLDLRMPVTSGLEVLRHLKAQETTREIPVMFVGASSDEPERLEVLALGAVDYIERPFAPAELQARLRTHVVLGHLRAQLESQSAPRTRQLLLAFNDLQHEIAERKRTEQALRESEERFRNMANTAPVMIVVAGPDQQATFFNRRWLDFTGRTMEQELGRGWIAGVHAEDLEHCLAGIAAASDTRTDCNLEYRLRRADGEYRSLICSGAPLYENGTFAGFVASCTDITDLKRAQEEALARQKLESLGMLTAGIAHDFNNLLSSILADSDLLLAELGEASPAREGIERIGAVAVRASEIVRELLVYAGQESKVSEPVDVGRLAREMLHLTKATISKNAELRVDLPEQLPLIQANAAQIRQVFMNLITNASEALEGQKGLISVSLAHIPAATGASHGHLRLEVADTGSGMTDEIRARIFDPFFTTKSTGKGLGLAATQGIIRAHGGSIKVSSAPGKGSRFEILLPCIAQPETKSRDAETSPAAAETGAAGGTVLLIDDEETLRLAAAKMLRKQGFSVLEAGNGHAGVEVFLTHAREIDAVLLDVNLPGLAARHVLDELRKLRPDIRVVLTTAYSRDRAVAAVGGQEPLLYIRKPYQLAELIELLRQACRDVPRYRTAT